MGAGVVGAIGDPAFEGIVMIGARDDVLSPPPQAESSKHATGALKRLSVNQSSPQCQPSKATKPCIDRL